MKVQMLRAARHEVTGVQESQLIAVEQPLETAEVASGRCPKLAML